MIISGGVNIYPAEIEAELSGHPAVDDVAVFGIPHDEWGEEIKAVVQPAPGIEPGPALTAELLAFLGGRLAKFKLPKSIDYMSELPRDPNGKLYKRRLTRQGAGHWTRPRRGPSGPAVSKAWLPGFLICDSQYGILCAWRRVARAAFTHARAHFPPPKPAPRSSRDGGGEARRPG